MRVSTRSLRRQIPFCCVLAIPAGLKSPLAAQTADSTTRSIQSVVTQLPVAGTIRIATAGQQWSGRLAARGADSLSVARETGIRIVRLADIDTLWVPGSRDHDGLLSGLGFGALFFGLLQLGDDSESPGLNTRIGLIILGGATIAGLLVDGLSGNWEQRYPTSPR